jgi:signal transduction histidine kinase/CheY-like chemotaxis protein
MSDLQHPHSAMPFDRQELLRALRALGRGDFSVRMTADLDGIDGELAEAFNDIVRTGQAMTAEFARIREAVGRGGKLDQRVAMPAACGAWAACVDSFNLLVGDLGAEPADTGGFRRRATDNVNQLAARRAKAQIREDNLQRTNRRLRENARQLSEQMKQIEHKNTEVELAKAALEEKAEQLALSSRYKSEFLANMSHELRTPLNSLLILAQMLAEDPAGNLTPKQVEFAQTIHAAGNDLLALINDVLDLAKVESGTVTLAIALEPFAELRDYLDRAFGQIGHDKALRFRISMDGNLPSAIWTDANRLRQILKNLLSNAFKFTARGTVSIEVAMAKAGWTPGHPVLDKAGEAVAFSVADTGIGIPADKQQIIFEAFRQADGTTSRHFGGTGLGLSISSRLAHLLGGEIKVQSTRGKGSTFVLYLPLVANTNGGNSRIADGSPVEPVREPAHTDPVETLLVPPNVTGDPPPVQNRPASGIGPAMPELAGRKVLLVDDDIRSIFALTSALERQAMIVVNAESGMDAIETLTSNPDVDIILMDMMMPGLDGYGTIRVIRGLEHFRSVPIIGVSAKAMKGDGRKAIEAGASDYISKPVELGNLLSLIRKGLAG